MITDDDRRGRELHIWRVRVMACRTKEAVLTDGRVRADVNISHAITIDPGAEAAVGTHDEIPGAPDPGRRVNNDPAADVSPEQTQEAAAPAMENRWAWSKQKQ